MLLACITPAQPHPDEFQWLLALLQAGIERLHVRKPHYTPAQLEAFLSPLITRGWAHRMVLHTHFDIALAFGIPQVHLPAQHRAQATRLAGRIRLSTSAHSIEEVQSLDPIWEYAFLSPIFPSISKPGYAVAFPEEQLRTLPSYAPCPLLALGGIDATRIHRIAEWGWRGAALLGAIWQQPTLTEALSEYRRIQRYAHPHTR